MKISYNYFSNESEAVEEIKTSGQYEVKLDVLETENDYHWHDFHSTLYILDGVLELTYRDTGETLSCGAGTRIESSPGLVHREKTSGYKAIAGLNVDPSSLTQPIKKPPID